MTGCVEGCGHGAAHAGRHGDPQLPATAYCAPGRCYCGSCRPAEVAPEPAPEGERWGRDGQADARLVRWARSVISAELAEANAKWRAG